MKTLTDYANYLAKRANAQVVRGQFFAKVLTKNDDSGRHGVLIPADAYLLFPALNIVDPQTNVTVEFLSIDSQSGETRGLAYKYYQRYPERRITRLNPVINDQTLGKRLQIIFCAELADGAVIYIQDATNELGDGRFHQLWELLAGKAVEPEMGVHLVVPMQFSGVHLDAPLCELLSRFDKFQGTWVDSLRTGDTGIGYTLESLLGIQENNDMKADFLGIEIKSKRKKENQSTVHGKLNLFQQGPEWASKKSAIERIQEIGLLNANGLYSCYSQVTTKPNNLNLALLPDASDLKVDLKKNDVSIGHWLNATLEARLMEKHTRAVFVLASEKITKTRNAYCYDELIYCEQPSINRFMDLISKNQLVFEFTMSQKENGSVRNHGYPWRLNREDLLDQLFAVRVKLR